MAESKKLYRSRHDRQIAGVCGGLAEYFSLDPTVVRLVFVVLTLMGGPGLLLYIVLALVVPEEAEEKPKNASTLSDEESE
jgi:phage shock protein C